jgi:plastocyanin
MITSIGRALRTHVITGAVVAALLGVAVVASACSSGSPSSSPTTTTVPGGTGSGGGSPVPGAATIAIQNFSFSPSTMTVSPGERITVTNKDSVTHTLTSTTMKFNTGDIASGRTAVITAPSRPGRYPYYCMIHQYMTGTLVVKG